MKYRRKPIIVEAIRWDETNLKECIDFLGNSFFGCKAEGRLGSEMKIRVLDKYIIVGIGDYIIKDIQGEFHSCNPYVFELEHELVGE